MNFELLSCGLKLILLSRENPFHIGIHSEKDGFFEVYIHFLLQWHVIIHVRGNRQLGTSSCTIFPPYILCPQSLEIFLNLN